MNKKIQKESKILKKSKLIIFILSFVAAIFAILTHLSMINFNLMYYWFGSFTTVSLWILPILSVGIIIFSSILIFRYNKMAFITPVIFALAGTFLALALADESSKSKIQSDFLKYENEFNQIVDQLQDKKEGVYEIDNDNIFFVAPEQKVIVKAVGNGKYAYCIVTLDIDERIEGYVFEPDGSPDDWLLFGQYFDEQLDINKEWSYFAYYKGVSYD